MSGSSQSTKYIDDFDLETAPGHLLRRNHQRSYEIFADLVGTDVTRQQIALLIALAKNPGASQNDMVALTGFDKSTLREMLGRLVEKGWVARERDPDDSRAWRIDITPLGRALLDEKMKRVKEVQNEIMAPLPSELRPVFLSCLQIMLGMKKA